jgi:hypothetical protein
LSFVKVDKLKSTPEPDKANASGFPAESVIVRLPLRIPVALGVKMMFTIHLELLESVAGQLFVCL